MKLKIILAVILLLAVILVVIQVVNSRVSYSYKPVELPKTFKQFYNNRLKRSKELNARPGNEEKLVRFSGKKTDIAILYIHGYGASRGEGEYVVDKISKKFKANTYYLRLPGHGTSKEDHAEATYRDHLQEVTETLFMMEKLGKKVIVIGTSMGGLLATYLAANYPEKIYGLVLCSPFYDFASSSARMMHFYPIFKLFTAISPMRIDNSPVPEEKDNWTLYWYKDQYMGAIKQTIDLLNFAAKDSNYSKVTIPVLMLYYYKDENTMDGTASVPHMKEAFSHFGSGSKPHPLNRAVAIADGSHVMTSKYIKVDYKTMEKEIAGFIKKLQEKK